MDETHCRVHTFGCDPPRGLQGYGLGFSHSQRTGAVLALRVTESLVDTCARVSDAHRWVSHFSVCL